MASVVGLTGLLLFSRCMCSRYYVCKLLVNAECQHCKLPAIWRPMFKLEIKKMGYYGNWVDRSVLEVFMFETGWIHKVNIYNGSTRHKFLSFRQHCITWKASKFMYEKSVLLLYGASIITRLFLLMRLIWEIWLLKLCQKSMVQKVNHHYQQ